METLTIDIKSTEDKKLFSSLAKRLNLRTRILSKDDKEDIGLALAIDEGRKSGYVDEKTIMRTLGKAKRRQKCK